ncbi:TonB-dependent receptor domain-containing protein [Mucilaginibacter myungsuensis]|uniref:TonB-dependent receptor n=1 Tax=Mucilaginibacter myungsuensis TaxID=649104 RepID=A0A929PYX8_9SPHI|nr:TonB-dependent receptor [Mucilaginibacter myungsuensis]MBE9663802.1 TonB-dependent receptor [Mucilaginibacter myungsuensis]MDN3598483.1 TonB-dependent receptor [Mucilaginibacter myungsuensis]
MHKALLAIFCLISATTLAQTSPEGINVSGTAIDSATNKPLGYVTIALIDAATRQPAKSTLSKDDGTFAIINMPQKACQLSLIYVGYQTKTISIKGDADVKLGNIMLSPSNSQLKEVSVSGLKPLMKQEVDRMSYDVAADPESRSITALDMMRKVPLVAVDAQDNITMRGSGNYRILLNGKESALMARNPADILKAMPASNIVRIEVITTPPAKYDAEGLAGIINIITTKNSAQGYNGSVSGGYNSVFGYRANVGITVKQGKFGINGFAGSNERPYIGTDFTDNTNYLKAGTSVNQTGFKSAGNKNTYANAELSYEIDSLNLLTGMVNAFNNDNRQGNDQFTQQYNAANALTQAYNVTSGGTGNGRGMDMGLNYQLGFKRNKQQLLTVSYKYLVVDNSLFNDIRTGQLGTPNFRQDNKSGSKEYTTQIDYLHPLTKLTIEAGGKMILRNNFSNFITEQQATGGNYVNDPDRTNNFDYHQDVYSAYNSYTYKFDPKWVLKGGARFERTVIVANFSNTTGGNFSTTYNNLVPSISMQKILTASTGLTFGFTRRIQRPVINQLNPFPESSNPQQISQGNPALRPAVNNNFELAYNNAKKGNVNIMASYSFANNTIQTLSTVNGTVTTNTFANLGKFRQAGLDASINYPITKRLTANLNLELLYIWLNGYYNGQLLSNAGYQGHAFTNYNYKVNDRTRIGMNVNFDSRYVFLQGRDNYFLGGGLYVSRDFFNKALSVAVNANNPFSKFLKLDFRYRTDDFDNASTSNIFYRTFNISFNYKFGRLNTEIKKNQRGINNDDAASGRN